MQYRWKLWLVAVAAIVIVLVLARDLSSRNNKQAAGPARPKTVIAQTVAKIAEEPTLSLTGSIEAVQEAVISAQVTGQVTGVRVQNGEMVAPGQPLVLVDDSSYRDALAIDQANLESAQVSLESAQQNYQRTRACLTATLNQPRILRMRRWPEDTAQANVDSAAATLNSARVSLQETSISSPISGVAANCNVEVGEFLSPGVPPATSLLQVEDISSVYAVVNIEQGDLPSVETGHGCPGHRRCLQRPRLRRNGGSDQPDG